MSKAQENASHALEILSRVKARLAGRGEERRCMAGGTCVFQPAAAPKDAPPGTRWETCSRCFAAREVPPCRR